MTNSMSRTCLYLNIWSWLISKFSPAKVPRHIIINNANITIQLRIEEGQETIIQVNYANLQSKTTAKAVPMVINAKNRIIK